MSKMDNIDPTNINVKVDLNNDSNNIDHGESYNDNSNSSNENHIDRSDCIYGGSNDENISASSSTTTTTTTTTSNIMNHKRKLEQTEYQDKYSGKQESDSIRPVQTATKTQRRETDYIMPVSPHQQQQLPPKGVSGKRVHRLIDLCSGAIVKNVNNIDSLEKLPDELCQTLISIFQRSKLLNKQTLSLFKNSKLTKLDFLGKDVQIYDDWLSITKGAMSSTLVTLNLSKNINITDEGIANLSHLRQLNSLDVSYCDAITGSGLTKLMENKVPLQKINLQGCMRIDIAKCLEVLSQFPLLDTLNISTIKLSNVLCAPLKLLRSLTQLDISNNNDINDFGIQHISAIATLKDLDISGCRNISHSGFLHFNRLSKLQTLQASDCGIEDQEMAFISKLTGLKTLTLINNPFTDIGAAHISKLTSLTALDLSMCTALTDEALEHLKTLTQITRLNLNFNSNLTDTGVASLTGGLSDLTSLGIIGCNRLLIKVKHKPLVLLVEDNAMQVTLISKIMQRNNFEVEVASNGQMALDMYKSNPKYELILMDIIMPIMDGLTATMLIRDYERERGLKRTPVIMQTADTDEGHKKCCLEAGCDDFMLKPLDKKVVDLAHKLFKKDNEKKKGVNPT